MHDYYLSPIDFFDILYWWEEDEPIYCPQIKTLEGKRHSDWMVNPNHMKKFIERYDGVANKLMAAAPHENAPWFVNALPYNMNLSPIQYVSGGLMMLKTEVLLDIPMNENLRWGDAEDVEFSERAVAKYKLTRVRGDGCHFTLMKPNKWAVSVIPDDVLPLLEEYSIECQTTTS
jgi:hypothetical protein